MTDGRVALVRPLASGWQEEFQEPLGAEALCGYLRRLGWDCRVFARQLARRLSRNTLEALREYNPRWIGFSLLTESEARDALRLWQLLKQPGRECWAGGFYITTAWEQARALFPAGTLLIRGEGERAAAAFLGGKPIPTAPLAPDGWAEPSRDELSSYLRCGGVINMRSARGCAGQCSFCATPQLPAPRYAARSIRLVADEMEALASRYEPIFNFVDDDFGSLERMEDLSTELRHRALKAAFSLELRAGELTRGTDAQWRRLHEGGLCRVFVGLENLDPETLRRWGKPIRADALLRAVRRCRGAGIETAVGYILWHERSTPEAALAQMEALHQNGLLDPKIALSRLILFPGSRLYRETGAHGPARPVELSPRAASFYGVLERRLGPALRLWTRAAALLPGACCRDHLRGDKEAEKLRALLGTFREQCYLAIFQQVEPDLTAVAEGLDAFCAACN